MNQQALGAQQAFFIQAWRASQGRDPGEDLQAVLFQHVAQAFQRHGGELAPGQFGQAIEVEELVLREQHHQRADFIVQQYGLHLGGGR
ncbi:hypothetical protein D3C76_1606880 [compost metagenome]